MRKLYISIIIITSTLLTFAFSNTSNDKKSKSEFYKTEVEDSCKIQLDTITKIDTSHTFNTENFKAYLKQINAPHAHIISALSRES